jgi:hypothetical protein
MTLADWIEETIDVAVAVARHARAADRSWHRVSERGLAELQTG